MCFCNSEEESNWSRTICKLKCSSIWKERLNSCVHGWLLNIPRLLRGFF
jgi:hypothetical protein